MPSERTPSTSPDAIDRHRLYEDVLAMLTGTLLTSLGITLYSKAMLATGGVTGLALLLQYATKFSFGTIFFVINLPFYYLAIRRMGWPFTIRTFIAVALVSVFARLTPLWIDVSALQPVYASVMGGALMGLGMLILFRHRAGLGGITSSRLPAGQASRPRRLLPARRGHPDPARRAVRAQLRAGSALHARRGGAEPGDRPQPPPRPLSWHQLVS